MFVEWHAFASLDLSATWHLEWHVLVESDKVVRFRPCDLLVTAMGLATERRTVWDCTMRSRAKRRRRGVGGDDGGGSDNEQPQPEDRCEGDEGEPDSDGDGSLGGSEGTGDEEDESEPSDGESASEMSEALRN